MSMSLLLSYKCIHLYNIIESTCKLYHIYLFVFLFLTYFSKYYILQDHLCCCKRHYLILFVTEQYSTVCTNTTSLSSIHLSMNKYLGCLCVLAIVSTAGMNIGVHVSFQITVFPGSIPRNGIAGLYSNSVFCFLRNLHGLHQLTFPPTVWEDSLSPHPLQHLLFSDSLTMGFLTVSGCTSLQFCIYIYLFIYLF